MGKLNALTGFVHANLHQNGLSNYQSSEKGRMQEALMQERKSLLVMKPLLDHTVEVLALWKFVCDHQLHLLDPSMSAIMWMSLKPTVLRDLILSARILASVSSTHSSTATWTMPLARTPSRTN